MAKANTLAKGRQPVDRPDEAVADDSRTRRAEILQTAASLIASSGLRTSLQEIAEAAGILPGSLYHHFESKEAILIELIRRYQNDLNRVGLTAQQKLDEPDSRPVAEKITELGSAIANCAVAHQAALQMSFYEGPSADPELMKLTQQRPAALHEAMVQTLRAARWSGYIKPEMDLPTLADRICQTMLQVGLDVIRHHASADQVARLMCRIILQGLATRPRMIRSWTDQAPWRPPTTPSRHGPTTRTPTPATKQPASVP
ncbi:bacterial regulatory s, tetR family protein [Mycobacterium kansasii]|uniref:Bacterial regulatory s, tetR family protein n=1 Tax=Mycobacterium kansasii TaxID=1768 RepID=A0A1V3XII2_MYCKA|nr:bacterial regulatory s, tetR family protein [Mycobacterium kansasii]